MSKTIRFICLFLTVLLTGALLAGCNSDGGTSGNESQANSDDPEITNYRIAEINALYKHEVDRANSNIVCLSTGAAYTISRESAPTVPDDGKKLTDGYLCPVSKVNEEFSKYVGVLGRNEFTITLDLGVVKQCITDFSIYFLISTAQATNIPRRIIYSVSEDGESYTEIGTVFRADGVNGTKNIDMRLRLEQGIDARYIKVTVPADAIITARSYFDEFHVYTLEPIAPVTEEEEVYYYNNPEFDTGAAEGWDSSDSDYNTKQNLAKDKQYAIRYILALPDAVKTDYYNTQPSTGLLTDGKIGGESWSDGAYAHFTNGSGRQVVIDLTKLSAPEGYSISFFYHRDYAIYLPATVSFFASNDGEGWQRIAQRTLSGTDSGRKTFTGDFDKITKARYIMVSFDSPTHVWCDEIEIFGTKNIEAAQEILPDQDATVYPDSYLPLDALGGSQNILLSYNFKVENPSVGLIDKDQYMPYVAYYDTNGVMQDTFFDSYLYLACSTVCPSGGRLYYYPAAPANKSDWLAYEEDTFKTGYNVNALNAAVKEVRNQLSLGDYKAFVYMPIYSTVYGDTNFGDVDDDGINEDFTNIEDRKKAIKWWIDRLIARFDSYEYEALKLNGFYWYHEGIETSDPHELELVKYAGEYLHSLGLYYIWIPYYCASGFADWASYGFDAANMQPNYMFNEDTTANQVYENGRITKMLGMGVEIEISGRAISEDDYLERYRTYLRAGVEQGYMNSIKMYYQDAGPGVFYNAYKSSDPEDRSIYDDTYLFAKRKLKETGVVLESNKFTCDRNGSVTISLTDTGGTNTRAQVYVSCRYGTVKENADGTLTYTAPENCIGEDVFTILAGNTLFTTLEEITIEIK